MKAIQALSKDFFKDNVHPITLRSIHGDHQQQHPGDLTDLEHWHDFAELVITCGKALIACRAAPSPI